MSGAADRQRQLNRERQKRWRARQHPHRREIVVPVPLCESVVNDLAKRFEWFDRSEDPKTIGAAIAAELKKLVTRY